MKLKLAVLFGGKSVEHEVSVITALQAIAALDKSKYDVLPMYLTKDNAFYIGPAIGDIEAYKNIDGLLKKSQQVVPAKLGGKAVLLRHPARAFKDSVLAEMDCVFPIVHGTNTEDGTLQGLLRLLGVPFVGPDVTASAIGMDKYAQKCVFKDAGIPVLDCVIVRASAYDLEPDTALERIENFDYPVIVKPVNLGSSVGISKADDRESLQRALELAFQFAPRVLVEPAVQNLREINCSILGDADAARASVCEEPLNADEILSYENKYMGSGSKSGKAGPKRGAAPQVPQAQQQASKGMAGLDRKIPADISPELAERVQNLAIKAFQALDCNGVARIDFLMDGQTGALWLNEINTIPGSLAFYLWEPSGLPYAQQLDEMISLAFTRARNQEDILYSFDTNILANAKLGGAKK
ncbi:MAG: D-alanine--D-alanine ligase [Oscillospiraceae bacterium]|nr:D-alanine--D-alanine ligase [Oscillospiraceae bacterium]